MNGRKRDEEREEREDESKGKSERSELRPPDTSALISLLTLSNTYYTPTLNPTQFPNICSTQNTILSTICPTFLSTLTRSYTSTFLYTTYSNTTIFSFRLSSSSNTECTLEAEHVTPFSFTFGTTEIICPM
jgi:hypothetical protein